MTNDVQKVTFVIPLYNEQKRIVKTLPIIEKHLKEVTKKTKVKTELVLVNDGSSDKTVETVKGLITFKNHIFVNYKHNKGKGYALKRGFARASGDYILFMDADLSTPLKHTYDFLNAIEDKNTIIIGSRKTKGANVTKHQPWLRENLGKGFTLLSNIFLVWGVSDFTCGFKMFPNAAGKKIFKNTTINRWGFDSEVLFLAKKYGYNIKEVPVSWKNDGDTKVDLKKDILRSLKDIFEIRVNYYKNRYKT